MVADIICVVSGLILGMLIMFVTWLQYDRVKERRRIDSIFNNYEWCDQCCKNRDYCFSNNKNPDDACEELINNYCVSCPMSYAQEIIYKEEHKNG